MSLHGIAANIHQLRCCVHYWCRCIKGAAVAACTRPRGMHASYEFSSNDNMATDSLRCFTCCNLQEEA